jgi:3-hydroxybutyryl-CoA dehydrogenase
MGSQIAMQCALRGFAVSLQDLSGDLLNKAMERNRGYLERRVEKGKLSQQEMDTALARVQCETDLHKAAGNADFVIEAVFEKIDVKKDVFSRLDKICPSHTILATNSSYFGNSMIAPATQRPDKVVNMHFFNPVLIMKLVEVVQGKETSEETIDATVNLVRRIDRVPVVLRKEVSGFLVNRIVMAIRLEAFSLLENGVASFKDIDTACELGLNHPMGPFKLIDFSGLDISYSAMMEKYKHSNDRNDLPPKTLKDKVEKGELGRKTGRGFYEYGGK